MNNPQQSDYRNTYLASDIHEGDPYELSYGHLIQCMATGGRGSRTTTYGAQVLETDPDVQSAGVDTGFSPVPNILRAPDIAVGNIPNEPGWVHSVPPLAVEYADTGQDENSLADKIKELFAYGTKYIWVVRLTGPRLVEVHEQGKAMRRVLPGAYLTAPGILRNPVKVEALYDREAAHEATLRNLLQRQGYSSLDAVRLESKAEGEATGIEKGKAEGEAAGIAKGKAEGEATLLKRQIIRRFGVIPIWAKQRLDKASTEQIETWAEAIFDAKDIDQLLNS